MALSNKPSAMPRNHRHECEVSIMARNTYEATVKLPEGGMAKVMVQATSTNHARQLLELQYGKGRVMNVYQKS